MADAPRSGCPINLSVEVFGDRWSLLILRDMIFGGRRHFLDLMKNQKASPPIFSETGSSALSRSAC